MSSRRVICQIAMRFYATRKCLRFRRPRSSACERTSHGKGIQGTTRIGLFALQPDFALDSHLASKCIPIEGKHRRANELVGEVNMKIAHQIGHYRRSLLSGKGAEQFAFYYSTKGEKSETCKSHTHMLDRDLSANRRQKQKKKLKETLMSDNKAWKVFCPPLRSGFGRFICCRW
jgi:hypothetical protein